MYDTQVSWATAECGNGRFSDSTGSGTCSGNGGVKRWLDGRDNAPNLQSGSISSQSYSQVESTQTFSNVEGNEPLANTGGDPLLFVALGTLLAGGSLFLRRRLARD